jgi:tRNA modification GTPase
LPHAAARADCAARARARRPRHREARPTAFVCPDTGETLDRGILLWFDGPRSFTGEDVAELHVHGSQAVVRAVLGALGRLRAPASAGAVRHAEPGEFTRRAFRNGKLDLTQAEGLADLLDAETEAQRRQALSQAGGALRRTYERWRRTLLRAHAHVEATLDFGEDDEVSVDVFRAAASETDGPVAALRRELERRLRAPPSGELTRAGARVCLVGPPNAGKSSLLNALAGREVAIVSSEPGTTRDAVEATLNLGGRKAVVADTAGARAATEPVEAEGVRRAQARAADADVVVLVLDGASFEGARALPRWALERADVLVLNKADLGEGDDAPLRALLSAGRRELPTTRVSCATGSGLDALAEVLRAAVEARAGEVAGDGAGVAAITRSRHRARLRECVHHLGAFAAAAASETGRHEVAAEELRLAARALGRVTGAVDVEELLDVIFSDFCIGK